MAGMAGRLQAGIPANGGVRLNVTSVWHPGRLGSPTPRVEPPDDIWACLCAGETSAHLAAVLDAGTR